MTIENVKNSALGRKAAISNRMQNALDTSAPLGRGSWEGYMHASSTYIQPNDSGYLSSGQFLARRATMPKKLSTTSLLNPISNRGTISSSVFDYTSRGKSGSSISRLAKLTRLGKMF